MIGHRVVMMSEYFHPQHSLEQFSRSQRVVAGKVMKELLVVELDYVPDSEVLDFIHVYTP
jgi:hypothetical protein